MNVQLNIRRPVWEGFIAEILCGIRRSSRRGFAVNFLEHVPTQSPSNGLYRTEPLAWLDFCRKELACSAEIVRGYGMQEFTLVALVDREWTGNGLPSPSASRSRRTRLFTSAPKRKPDLPDARRKDLQTAASTLLSPKDHADEFRIHNAFRLLRQEAPVHWVALPRVKPFWAVTRYNDVVKVEQNDAVFIAGPRTQLGSEAAEASARQLSGKEQLLRTLAHMDDPDHHAYRAISQPGFFQPR